MSLGRAAKTMYVNCNNYKSPYPLEHNCSSSNSSSLTV